MIKQYEKIDTLHGSSGTPTPTIFEMNSFTQEKNIIKKYNDECKWKKIRDSYADFMERVRACRGRVP